jgi:hypothetical protein
MLGSPAGGCGPTWGAAWGAAWVAAAAVRPAATAAPGPAGVPGRFPDDGRCWTGVPVCGPAGATGPACAVDPVVPPGEVGGGCVMGAAGCCWAGSAVGLASGSSPFLPNPRRDHTDCLAAGNCGGSHTGTAPGACCAGGVPGFGGAGVRGCAGAEALTVWPPACGSGRGCGGAEALTAWPPACGSGRGCGGAEALAAWPPACGSGRGCGGAEALAAWPPGCGCGRG